MKKGMKSVVQTINLSNPKTCVRPKLVRKSVDANITDSQPDSNSASNQCMSRPATIKICRRQNMQRTYEPKLCDRPEKPPPLSGSEKLYRAVMFLVKGTITAGLIYWTYLEGFWGDSSKTEDLYYRITSTIAPSLSEQPNADDMQLPHLEEIKYSVLEMYNHMLVKGMDLTVGVPLEMYWKLRNLLLPYDEIKETETKQSDETDPVKM